MEILVSTIRLVNIIKMTTYSTWQCKCTIMQGNLAIPSKTTRAITFYPANPLLESSAKIFLQCYKHTCEKSYPLQHFCGYKILETTLMLVH